MIVGFVLALILFGLPLGIIGLFVVSILDQSSAETDNISQNTPASKDRNASRYRFGSVRALVSAARYK
jgi:hypothetical protein